MSVTAIVLLAGAGAPLALGHGAGGGATAELTRAGNSGSTVSAVQSALDVPADGVYGPVTKAAVADFQAANSLVVDGIVGPETLGALGVGGGGGPKPSGNGGSVKSAPASSGGGGVPGELEQIAQCESGGNPSAANGAYRGKYQFSQATWEGVGGSGDPAKASEAEQDKRATTLYRQQGTAPWAGCA